MSDPEAIFSTFASFRLKWRSGCAPDLVLLSGARSSPSTPFVESIPALPVAGFTLSPLLLQATFSLSSVSRASTLFVWLSSKPHSITRPLFSTAHDSTLNVVYPSAPDAPPQAQYSVRSASLPFMSLVFTREDQIVAAGHDCEPILFTGDAANGWTQVKSLDAKSGQSDGPASRAGGGRLNSEAFNRFKAADSRGIAASGGGGAVPSGERNTVHQNTITLVTGYEGQPGSWTKVATSGVDGRLVVWPVA